MAQEQNPGTVMLRDVRINWPRLWEPESSQEGGKPKYSAVFIIDPTTAFGQANKKACLDAIRAVGEAEWKANYEKIYKALDKNRKGFRTGESMTTSTGDIPEQYQGMLCVKAGRSEKQGPCRMMGRDKSDLPRGSTVIYDGCYVDAKVTFYVIPGTDAKRGGNAVFAALEGIMFRRNGEPLGGGGGGTASADDFDDLAPDEDGVDSSPAGGDDDLV